jgi:3-deoxy-7-phosphoheptulonate synthase
VIVVLHVGASLEAVDEVQRLLTAASLVSDVAGERQPVVSTREPDAFAQPDLVERLRTLPGVLKVVASGTPYPLVSRADAEPRTPVRIGEVEVGSREIVLMAGPCTVESEAQVEAAAAAVARAGAKVLRGGAYKPSTSPYGFQGMGLRGLQLLRTAADRHGLKVVSEVMHVRKIEEVAEYADILQVGTRNMQNFDLLREVGRQRKPVLLKRGMTAKLEEWLLAAEYVAATGNDRILLCERGVRTFEPYTRNTLDLSAVAALRELTRLPVVVDPSQGTGRRELVPPMCRAAVAAGADALLIEVHPDPDRALKDGAQSIDLEAFARLAPSLAQVAAAVDRELPLPVHA